MVEVFDLGLGGFVTLESDIEDFVMEVAKIFCCIIGPVLLGLLDAVVFLFLKSFFEGVAKVWEEGLWWWCWGSWWLCWILWGDGGCCGDVVILGVMSEFVIYFFGELVDDAVCSGIVDFLF